MITIWGRNTSSNVQVAMWAVAEAGINHRHQGLQPQSTFGDRRRAALGLGRAH